MMRTPATTCAGVRYERIIQGHELTYYFILFRGCHRVQDDGANKGGLDHYLGAEKVGHLALLLL